MLPSVHGLTSSRVELFDFVQQVNDVTVVPAVVLEVDQLLNLHFYTQFSIVRHFPKSGDRFRRISGIIPSAAGFVDLFIRHAD